jgi:PAS domain S-box-containing protein
MAAASTWSYGSVRTINIVLILMGQVAAGIFLSRRGLLWTTAAAVALLGLLTWADAAGLLAGQPSFAVSWRNWLTLSASLVGVAAMMSLNRTQVRLAQELHLREATQRLQTQLDRDLGQSRFSRLFRASPTPIFVQSMRTGAILDVNLAFERVLGYTRNEVLNRRDGFLWLHDEAYAAFSRDRRTHLRTRWHAITGIGHNGQQIALQICSERDDAPDDGLRITVLRVPGHMTSAMPTVYAPLEGGQGV